MTTINAMALNKTKQVSLSTLDALSGALGIEPGDLLEGDPKKRTRKPRKVSAESMLIEPLHPSGRKLSDFERDLLRLRLIGHEAHLLWCAGLKNDERKQDTALLLTLHNFGAIIVCRFLEIWKRFDQQSAGNRLVREAVELCEPLVGRINEWPGLFEFRNYIVAHKYQVHDRPEFIPPWVVLHTGRVPSNAVEWFVMLDCVRLASACVMAYFGDISLSLDPVLNIGKEPETPHGVNDDVEGHAERVRLVRLMDQRMAARGIDRHHPVFATLICKADQKQSGTA